MTGSSAGAAAGTAAGTASGSPPVERSAAAALAALFIAGVATRPQMIGVSPLLPLIQEDLAVPHWVVGLLPTIPLIGMGVFALAGPGTAQLFGTRLGMTLSLIAIAIFGVVRALAPDVILMLIATIPIGIGIGIAGALLPIAVKERFPARPAFATGMYTNGFQVGVAIPAAIVAPLAIWFSGTNGTPGWRESLLVISVAGIAIAGLWHVMTRTRVAPPPRMRASRPKWPIRDQVAWLLVISFALRAGIFQALLAWLPAIYVERGWSIEEAGFLPMAITIGGMPATYFVSRLADMGGSRRLYMGWASVMLVVAVGAHLVLPWIGYLGAVFCGVCLGTLFTIALTLPLDLAERPEDVGALASMMLAGGFLFSALAPFLLGAARDVTGDFNGSLIVLAAFCLLLVVVTFLMSPERLAAARAASRVAAEG